MDSVKQPKHYKKDADPLTKVIRLALINDMPPPFEKENLECFEAMISSMSIDEIKGYLRGNSFKYRWRYSGKNGVEDLLKAQWYENKLLILEQELQHEMEQLTGVAA